MDELVEAARSHPVVVLTGEAGAGKSSLAVALARPEITGGRVPDGFVHAIAVLGLTTNQRSLADDLERQLRRSLPEFADAVAEFERSVPRPQREMLDFLPRKVLRPLAYLAGQPEVRIVLDGFDQLPDGTREAVGEALAGARATSAWSSPRGPTHPDARRGTRSTTARPRATTSTVTWQAGAFRTQRARPSSIGPASTGSSPACWPTPS